MDGHSFGWRETMQPASWWKRKLDVKHSIILVALIAGITLASIVLLDSFGIHWASGPTVSVFSASGQG